MSIGQMDLAQLAYLADRITRDGKIDQLTAAALLESHIEASKRLRLIERVVSHWLDVEDKDSMVLRSAISQALTIDLTTLEGQQ